MNSQLVRSTVNTISPFICSSTTIIGPNEEAIVPALLDARSRYEKDATLRLEPRNLAQALPLIGGRVGINYNSAVVPVLVANISNQVATIAKGTTLGDDCKVTVKEKRSSNTPV